MASLSEEGAFWSYVLPKTGSNYIIKVKSVPSSAIIRNMETIFTNYSQFSYQQNHEHDLENQAHRRGDYLVPLSNASEDSNKNTAASEKIAKAGKYIMAGGEMLKQNILKAAHYIGKNLTHSQASAQYPNQQSIRSIEELKAFENAQSQFELSKIEVTGLLTLVSEIEKTSLSHAEQDIGVKIHPVSSNRWPAFKKTAFESAHSLWSNMDDALGTLSKTMKAKRVKSRLPEDKMDLVFKKIDQNIQGEAPLPTHQVFPDQQQSEVTQSKLLGQDKLNAIRFPSFSGLKNLGQNLGSFCKKL
jgi:hypothetical protein